MLPDTQQRALRRHREKLLEQIKAGVVLEAIPPPLQPPPPKTPAAGAAGSMQVIPHKTPAAGAAGSMQVIHHKTPAAGAAGSMNMTREYAHALQLLTSLMGSQSDPREVLAMMASHITIENMHFHGARDLRSWLDPCYACGLCTPCACVPCLPFFIATAILLFACVPSLWSLISFPENLIESTPRARSRQQLLDCKKKHNLSQEYPKLTRCVSDSYNYFVNASEKASKGASKGGLRKSPEPIADSPEPIANMLAWLFDKAEDGSSFVHIVNCKEAGCENQSEDGECYQANRAAPFFTECKHPNSDHVIQIRNYLKMIDINKNDRLSARELKTAIHELRLLHGSDPDVQQDLQEIFKLSEKDYRGILIDDVIPFLQKYHGKAENEQSMLVNLSEESQKLVETLISFVGAQPSLFAAMLKEGFDIDVSPIFLTLLADGWRIFKNDKSAQDLFMNSHTVREASRNMLNNRTPAAPGKEKPNDRETFATAAKKRQQQHNTETVVQPLSKDTTSQFTTSTPASQMRTELRPYKACDSTLYKNQNKTTQDDIPKDYMVHQSSPTMFAY